MAAQDREAFRWIDVFWLLFLAGLGVLPPLIEWHKDLILVGIGLFQIFESKIPMPASPARRRFVSVFIKLLLASLLVWHTGGATSSYYLIYFLPVVSAAMLYDGWGTMLWSAASCAAYGLFIVSALRIYRLTIADGAELSIRYIFFFLVAVVVNRYATENRRQAIRFRRLAEELTESNQRLRQAQEEARRSERLAALGQLSAGLAHEIRNPLGVIRGSAEMLSQRVLESDAITAELAGYISAEVERLNNLVGRILDFARPMELKFEKQEISAIVDRALKSVQEQHAKAQISVERQVDPNLPLAPVDSELAERVFANLFDNAFEAMPEGGTLRVILSPGQGEGGTGVEIRVEDTGPGIPNGQREHIFNPFFTTKKTGVGLGLSIVAKIVDDHHGWIRLENEPGKGARFRLFFPGEG